MAEASRPAPCRLSEGVALEDAGLLLRWGMPIAELAEFESPAVLRHPNSVHLTWSGRVCLGGLPCDVGATRICETPNPRAYHLYLAEFHWAELRVRAEWGESDGEVEQGFRQVFRHLERELGPPTFSYPEYERGLPAIFWEFPRLLVGYSLLGGRPGVSVAHEPDGYASLKAAARAIRAREGEGARVNFVAWPGWQGRAEPGAAPDRGGISWLQVQSSPSRRGR
jgi:hypothetical protein